MENFKYENKCEIIFGQHDEQVIAEKIKSLGCKMVLLHYGMGSVIKNGILDKITTALKKSNLKYIELGGVRANPYKSLALKGIQIAKQHGVDFILALGGGSVIDSSKCIAVGALSTGDVWSHYQDKTPVTAALPIGAILTIPAAGSECSTGSVIKDDQTGIKYSITGTEWTRPKFAFINPAYCATLPPHQIANGASDMLAHLIERYLSDIPNQTLTDNLLTAAIHSVFKIAPKVYADIAGNKPQPAPASQSDQSYNNMANLCLLGTLAHNSMLNMGRGYGDWAAHRIDTTLLSGINDIAHGQGLAIVFPALLKFLSTKNLAKINQFIREVTTIDELENFYKTLNLPARLSDLNLSHEKISRLVKTLFPANTTLGSFSKLTPQEIEAVIELAK